MRVSPGRIDTYYDTIAPSYDELYETEQYEKLKLIYHHLDKDDKNSAVTILDVGCGTGITARLFKCNLFVGIDPSLKLLRYAKEKFSQASWVRAVAEHIPFKSSIFDTVIALTAVHNFKSITAGLGEIKRTAKRRVILTVLYRCKNYHQICKLISEYFKVDKIIGSKQDRIYICRI
jgi:ubiquinone/menaquinone biosynthesis C-methylase UbiE